jgi:sugar (pentulose or hexulose) kinase
MSDLVLGVDCSTTASKVTAWDRHGKSLANLVKSLTADRIVGLCISHQRESYAPVNESNHSLRNAIL